jgi:hypothetical protein
MPGGGGSIRVDGLNKLVRDLSSLGINIDDLKDTFSEIAQAAAEVIRPGVPVKSGRLLASLRGNRAKNKAVVTAGRASVPYAGAINYGWPDRNIKGQRFMQRADAENERWVHMIDQGITEAIRKAGLA